MKRRDFITLLGGAAITWPFGARGQQLDRVPRIGILSLTAASDTRVQGWLAAIRQRLPELGWAEGSVRIDYRWGESEYSTIRQAKETLGQRRLDLDTARDQVQSTVIQAWGQLDAAKAQINATQERLVLAPTVPSPLDGDGPRGSRRGNHA
jgi:outer membrane protein TolC